MRLRDAILVLAMTAFATSACSRLTFVKPSAKRGKAEQIAPDYHYADDAKTKQRTAARNHVARALQHVEAGELDQAETEAKAALKSDPKSTDAYTMLAAIAEERGRSADAGGYYLKATDLAPNRGDLLNNYGAWLCANGRAAEALGLFDRALADPAYQRPSDALANTGACALRIGQMDRVEANLRQALALDPNNPVGLAAMTEYEFRNGRYLQARAFSERRLAAAPVTPEVLQLASQIEYKLGDTAAADRYVQRSRTEFPQARTAQPGGSTQP